MAVRTKKAVSPPAEGQAIEIKPLKIRGLTFTAKGTAPLVQLRFTKTSFEKMWDDMTSDSQFESKMAKKAKRKPKDEDVMYEEAMYESTEGWRGVPAASFRNAMIDACRLSDMPMTQAKQVFRIIPDGFDKYDGTALVRITKGKPKKVKHVVRNNNGAPDIRVRAMWDTWEAKVKISFDNDILSYESVANLLSRAGQQVGIGEGRNGTRGKGMGWGFFTIEMPKHQ